MHHCLCTVELLDKIARNVDAGRLNMALACKAFYEPAMNALWRKMDGLEPLIRCLPSHVLGDGEVDLLSIIAKPEDKDWSRVLHYSVRIRELQLAWQDLEDEHFTGLEFEVYGSLREYIPCSRLLPNLEKLICHDNMGSNASYFIQPPLRSFTIYDLREYTHDIAAQIKESGRSVQELKVLDDELVPDDEDAFKDIHCMITALDQLTTLVLLGPLSENALKHLASLRELSSLTFDLSKVDYARILPQASANTFPALRKLKVIVKKDHKKAVASFLFAIRPPRLIDLHVEYEQKCARRLVGELQIDEDHLRAVFSAMARIPSLEHISVTVSVPHIEATGVVTASVFEPILALQGLRSLHLSSIQLRLTSSDVERLVWPNIETLHLCPKSSVSKGLASKDIALLKEKCPLLRNISVKL